MSMSTLGTDEIMELCFIISPTCLVEIRLAPLLQQPLQAAVILASEWNGNLGNVVAIVEAISANTSCLPEVKAEALKLRRLRATVVDSRK